MVIISRSAIQDFNSKHPVAANALNDWYSKTTLADWSNFHDVKQTFNSCDYVENDRYVFNIMGNNYRLVALIVFGTRTVFIRGVMTHTEYDRLSKNSSIGAL